VIHTIITVADYVVKGSFAFLLVYAAINLWHRRVERRRGKG